VPRKHIETRLAQGVVVKPEQRRGIVWLLVGVVDHLRFVRVELIRRVRGVAVTVSCDNGAVQMRHSLHRIVLRGRECVARNASELGSAYDRAKPNNEHAQAGPNSRSSLRCTTENFVWVFVTSLLSSSFRKFVTIIGRLLHSGNNNKAIRKQSARKPHALTTHF